MYSHLLPLVPALLLVQTVASTSYTTLTVCTGYTTTVIAIQPTSASYCATTTSATTTSTSTPPTPTPSGSCLVNPLCKPLGLDIDYYTNNIAAYSRQGSGVLSNYYIVDGLTPLTSSSTNITSFPTNSGTPPTGAVSHPNASLPATAEFASFAGYKRVTNGGITVDANNFTLVYHGFYRAPTTGQYTICTNSDNENDVYFGAGNAFNCLDGASGDAADPVLTSGFDLSVTPCTTITLTGGAYYPIRSVMGNWQGPSSLSLTIQAPGATTGTSDFTGLVYPQDCGIQL